MQLPGLTARARALWESLAGGPAVFEPAVRVTVSRRSLLCPAGWVGIVVIDGAAIATAPAAGTARAVQDALGAVPLASLTDPAVLGARLPVRELLGPASLAYLDAAEFRPQHGRPATDAIPPRDAALHRFLAAGDPLEVEESSMAQITSPAFAVREHGQIVAVAGYRDWPGRVAHLSVLTAPPARGRGLAHVTASAAVAHALHQGKLPQWRARPAASRRVARALGFRELGAQASIHLQA